jgi:PTS system galactitol-specific IIA component
MKQMTTNGVWVRTDLVICPLHARDAFDAIAQLGQRLLAAGCVKDSFIPAAIEREKNYATGLPTAGVQVAIPHTDVEHVLCDAIAVGVLPGPVLFGEMGNPGSMVNASLVCLLAATRAERVVSLLQRLAEMFQHADVLQQIVAERDPAAIAALMNQSLLNVKEIA